MATSMGYDQKNRQAPFCCVCCLRDLGRNGTENWVKDSIHRNAEWRLSTPSSRTRPSASEKFS
jgi:hypothetical protein